MGLSCVFTQDVILGNFIMPFQGGYVVSCHLPRALPWAVLLCPFRAVRVFNFPGIFPVAGAFTQDITLDCVLPIWGGCIKA
jgi:hypothetical protein